MKTLTHKQIRDMVDDGYLVNRITRERAQNDSLFYWITHWSDEWRASVPLRYQGQFDILRPAGRKIIADLSANQIDASFMPIDGTDPDLGDFLENLYRTDNRKNVSREALDNAMSECVPCGIGGWRLVTSYETDRIGDSKQVINREPIYEFNSTVIFDPQAKRIDKSDAKWCCVLSAYTPEGFKDLAEDLKSEKTEETGDFITPVTADGLWCDIQNTVYVGEFYWRYKKKVNVNFYRDLFGGTTAYYADDVKDIESSLKAAGSEKIGSKVISRWCVTKYIVSGSQILDMQEIAGTEIPIVPVYGERAFVNGVEHYEGIVKCAKDPQMLRDFQMSYLADIVSTSPRNKPIFNPEQIAGFEYMFSENGADNNYPYYLMNSRDPTTGQPLIQGPVAQMPDQQIPQALIASIEMTKEAVLDVSSSGAPNSIADTDLSGNAISQIKSMLDEQSIVYQQHKEYALRRDAEIYAGMVPDTHDIPRHVTLTLPNGTQKDGYVMQSVLDIKTGEHKVLNDLREAKFNVYVEVGTPYESQKQQNRAELVQLMQSIDPSNPMYQILMLKYLNLGGGMDMEDVRKYAHKQLILQGITEPETDEEKQWVAEAQQSSQEDQDPNMVLAQAEMVKAQAEGQKNDIEMFKAQTDRFNSQIKAQEVGANIDFTNTKKTGVQIDNLQKLHNPPKSNHEPSQMAQM